MATEHKGLRRPEAGVYVACRRVASISLVLLWALRDSPEGGVMSIKTYLTTRPWRRYMYIWLKARIPEFQCKKKKKIWRSAADTFFLFFSLFNWIRRSFVYTSSTDVTHSTKDATKEKWVTCINYHLTFDCGTFNRMPYGGFRKKREKKGPVFRENSKDWNVSQASSPVM